MTPGKADQITGVLELCLFDDLKGNSIEHEHFSIQKYVERPIRPLV